MTITNTRLPNRFIRGFDVEDFFKAKNKPLCSIKIRSRLTKMLVITTICSLVITLILPDILTSDAVLKDRKFSIISQNSFAIMMVAWGFLTLSSLITAIWLKCGMHQPSSYHSVKNELKTRPAWTTLPPDLIAKILNGSKKELQNSIIWQLNAAQCDAVLQHSITDQEVRKRLLEHFWRYFRNSYDEESLRKQEDAMLGDLLQQISTDNNYFEHLNTCRRTFGSYTSEKIITLYLISKLEIKNLKNIHDFAAKFNFKELVQACKDFLIRHQSQIACSVFFRSEKRELLGGLHLEPNFKN